YRNKVFNPESENNWHSIIRNTRCGIDRLQHWYHDYLILLCGIHFHKKSRDKPMNINFTAEELAFRDEVRAFFKEKLPKDIAAKVKDDRKLSKQDYQRWQRILSAQGWYTPHWPVEYGGTNWTSVQLHIFEEEAAAFGAPRTIPVGVNMVAPVFIQFGSEEQKQ